MRNSERVPEASKEHARSALADCEQCLELNPIHFAALSGKGLCHLMLDDKEAALSCLNHALSINPRLRGKDIYRIHRRLLRDLGYSS